MPAMTVALPPTGPLPIINIMTWLVWGTLGALAAAMVVMLVTASGRRHLHENHRRDPGHNVKLALFFGVNVLSAVALLWALQVISS